jgi:hypothetical protein
MTSLFPTCGPSCYREKKLAALQYEKDSDAYDAELYGHGWVQAKKETEAKADADKQVSEYRKQYEDILSTAQPEDSAEVEDMKYQIQRDSDLAAILNRLHTFFNSPPPPKSSSGWWFSVFLDVVITVFMLAIIYLLYKMFVASRMVGGKRLSR